MLSPLQRKLSLACPLSWLLMLPHVPCLPVNHTGAGGQLERRAGAQLPFVLLAAKWGKRGTQRLPWAIRQFR